MSTTELFGTVTSPYVRRVRIVLHELGIDYRLIDTSTESGQRTLRELNPLWKVPTARLESQLVFDSAAIISELLKRHGHGQLAAYEPDDLATSALHLVVDGALDALINVFYLEKDGVEASAVPYLGKQKERAASALSWVEARLEGPWLTTKKSFGLPEIALITALDWMRFRHTYPVERYPAFTAFLRCHAERESLKATCPPGL